MFIVSQFSIQDIYDIITMQNITVRNEAYILEKLIEYYHNYNYKFYDSNNDNNDILYSPSLALVYNIQWNEIPDFMFANYSPRIIFNISEKLYDEIKNISLHSKNLQFPFVYNKRRYTRIYFTYSIVFYYF